MATPTALSPSPSPTFSIGQDGASQAEWITLGLASLVSGLLSALASGIIVMIMFRDGRKKLSKIHNRFTLGISFVDILNSCALGLSTVLLPREFNQMIAGIVVGNKHTCSMQAFFVTIGFAAPLYEACLSLYLLAVIKYNVRDEPLLSMEPYVHGVVIVLVLCIALPGTILNLFHPTRFGTCWLSNGCDLANTTSHSCGSAPDCTYTARPQVPVDILTYSVFAMCVVSFLIIVYSMVSLYLFVRGQTITMNKYQVFERRNSIVGHDDKRAAHTETLIQAILMILAFISTYMFPLVTHVIKGSTPFAIKLLRSLCYPSHGVWNFVIYLRPRYVLLKEKRQALSFWQVMKELVFTTNSPSNDPGTSSRNIPTNRLSMVLNHQNKNNKKLVIVEDNMILASSNRDSKEFHEDESISIGFVADVDVDLGEN